MKLKGNGFVKFNDTTNEEEYLEKRIWILGNGSDMKLKAGEHHLPFSFVLPNDIPSSFKGDEWPWGFSRLGMIKA